jgi:hypothetical protein
MSICFYKKDFGFAAEWHFYATSHGKDPCDGVARTFKLLAAHVGLRLYDRQIMIPVLLHKWRMENIKMCDSEYITSLLYKEEQRLLQE